MHWLDFIVLTLAAGTPIGAWLHEDGICSGPREWIVAWGEPAETSRWNQLRGRIAQLLTCRFCLSHWTPIVLVLLFYIPSLLASEAAAIYWKLPLYVLAATRLSWLLDLHMLRTDQDDG